VAMSGLNGEHSKDIAERLKKAMKVPVS